MPASSEFCHLLTSFANSLDLNQAQQNIKSDLGQKELDPLKVFLKNFLKSSRRQKFTKNYPACKEIMFFFRVVQDLSFSNWVNFLASCDSRGTVVGVPMYDMCYQVDNKSFYKQRLVSSLFHPLPGPQVIM